ncbi:partial Chondramide synthase cmdD, partial [Anaerolineae bacterium]
LADLSTPELLTAIREIVDAVAFNIAADMFWMGPCAGSEMLLTRVYEKLVKRDGDSVATTFVMGYDSAPIRAEKSLYDLAAWLRARDEVATYVMSTPSEQLTREQMPSNVNADDWQEFCRRLAVHLHEFGHAIYDLDFTKPLPLDDPAPMLETIKMYLRGEGTNPHERQHALEAKRIQATENALRRVKGLKRWAFTKSLNWAQSLAEMREDGIADIGIGYPLLQKMLRELGDRLVAANIIAQADDVFWLRQNEIEQFVRGEQINSLADQVEQRKAFARAAKRTTPPPMLPPSKKYMGFNVEGLVAVDESSHTADTIKGAGTSAGRVTAPARVLSGPEDFDQMRPGEVLVAGITTPAWTPLFAMASAVVTDIGGPLSHGSIVAREYGIPAVLGTGVATKRIRSGQMITVDGSAGTVTLSKN